MKVLSTLILLAASLAGCGDSAAPGTPDGPPGTTGDGAPDGMPPDGMPIDPTCAAPATFAEGLTPTQILHVAAGAAAGGDGSAGAPFRSIEEAAAAATPGTAIRLGPGNHESDQFVAGLRGTATAPIWIGGEPGQPLPVLAGQSRGLQLVRPSYVVVHDLEISGATGNGLNIDDGGMFSDDTAASHIVVERLYVHDIGAGGNNDCIKVSGVNHLAVYDTRIENCGTGGSGVDHVGCHHSVVARTTFDGAMSTAVQVKGGSTDVDVRDNRIRITGVRAVNLGGSTDLDLFRPPLSTSAPNAEARRVRVYNNFITQMTASATPFAFVGCVDCLAAHNYVRGQQRWHVRILQETASQGGYTFEPSSNGRVINNTFVFQDATLSTAVNEGAGTSPATFTFSNNLWYASDAPAQSAPTLPVTETGGISNQPSGYANVPDDPRAPLPTVLLTGAAEAGAGVTLADVPGTIDGHCRGVPPSIGPVEAQSGSI